MRTDLAAEARRAGITITLPSASGPYIPDHYADPYTPATGNNHGVAEAGFMSGG